MSLAVMRAENFRIIIDSRGYMAAGRILRGFVRTTQRLVVGRGKAVLGRWNEDEFVMLAHCSGAAAVVMANEIRGKAKDIVLSAGVADVADGGYMSVSEFFGAAYEALSEAVNSGGNATVLARNS